MCSMCSRGSRAHTKSDDSRELQKLTRRCGTLVAAPGRNHSKIVPEEIRASRSEQTTPIRCRNDLAPATPQNGIYDSSVAWDAVLLRTSRTMPQKVRKKK